MKSPLQISIPNPCSADWNKMTPVEQGKFCGLCSLTVVDFSSMSEQEIKEYFRCHYGQKTCGHFHTTQLQEPVAVLKQFWAAKFHQVESTFRKSSLKTALLCGIIVMAFLTGCRNPATYSPYTEGKVEIMGDTVYIEKVDTAKTAPIPTNPVK